MEKIETSEAEEEFLIEVAECAMITEMEGHREVLFLDRIEEIDPSEKTGDITRGKLPPIL